MNVITKFLSFLIAATICVTTLTTNVSAADFTSVYASASASSSLSNFNSTSNVPNLTINKNSYINYTYGYLTFGSGYIWLYDFCDEMCTGRGNRQTKYGFNEMYLGMHAYVKNNKLYYRVYNNSKTDFSVVKTTLISDGKKVTVNSGAVNEFAQLSPSSFGNGLYKLESEIRFTKSKNTEKPMMYFYVNNGKVYLCSYTTMEKDRFQKEIIERRALNEKLLKEAGVTPENSNSDVNLCFPRHPGDGKDNAPEWAALSETIVKEEWSDSLKVFAFHEWMVKNLAYDNYKVNKLIKRRDAYFNDFSGKQDTYYTKTGVCFDFTNILAIMCRHHGIPAVTLDSESHTWNLVYLNGKWVEIDVTTDVLRYVNTEDYTKVKTTNRYYYKGFNSTKVNNSTPFKVNLWLWTYDRAKK